MLTMNKATLLGYAGRNPEMRKLPSGDDVAEFSLATTERFRRKDDTVGESTEWHSVVAFGTAAEAVRKLVRKGAPVLVEGRIASRTWTDRTGAERRAIEIVVSGPRGQVNVLARRRTGAGGDDPPGGPAAAGAASGTGPVEGGAAANGAAQAVSAGAAGSPSDEDAAAAGAESESTGEIAAAGSEAVAAADETGGDPPVRAAGHSEDAAAAGAESDTVGEAAAAAGDAAGEVAGGASAGNAGVEAAVATDADAGTTGPSDDDDDHD